MFGRFTWQHSDADGILTMGLALTECSGSSEEDSAFGTNSSQEELDVMVEKLPMNLQYVLFLDIVFIDLPLTGAICHR